MRSIFPSNALYASSNMSLASLSSNASMGSIKLSGDDEVNGEDGDASMYKFLNKTLNSAPSIDSIRSTKSSASDYFNAPAVGKPSISLIFYFFLMSCRT